MKQNLQKKSILFLLCILMVSVLGTTQYTQAKKKSSVKMTVKNGTLTIKGKGAIPSSPKIKNKKKIKKIVIKKGITSIPVRAFAGCDNLTQVSVAKTVKEIGQLAFSSKKQIKKITLPGKFKIITEEGDDEAMSIFATERVKTVSFCSDIDLSVLHYIVCEEFVAKKTDKNFTTIDGILYSKDKKDVVRVPYLKETVQLADTTENFCLSSILYATLDFESDPLYSCRVSKIIIPESVKCINIDKYKSEITEHEFGEIELDIQNKNLDGKSLAVLQHQLNYYDTGKEIIEQIATQLPEQIIYENNMYISGDGVLLYYDGKGGDIVVPDTVTSIGDGAFMDTENLKSVKLPENLVEIGEDAFAECIDWMVPETEDTDVFTINIPASVKRIGHKAFQSASIKNITLPEGIEYIGANALSGTKLESLVIPDKIKEIPESLCMGCPVLRTVKFSKAVERIEYGAFGGCPLTPFDLSEYTQLEYVGSYAFSVVEWKTLTLPKSLKVAEEGAFASAKKIIIPKACKTISTECGECPVTVFQYETAPKKWKTNFIFESAEYKKKTCTVEIVWNRIAQTKKYKNVGYEIVLSKNKNCKKVLKRVRIQKNINKKKITVPSKDIILYGKIRPFVMKKGKRIYGRWSSIGATYP